MSEEDDESIGRRILLDDESRKIRRRILQRGKKIRDSRYLVNIEMHCNREERKGSCDYFSGTIRSKRYFSLRN